MLAGWYLGSVEAETFELFRANDSFRPSKKRSGRGSDVCLSVTRAHEASVVAWLTLAAVAAATVWVEQKGDRRLLASCRLPPHHCGELAAQ